MSRCLCVPRFHVAWAMPSLLMAGMAIAEAGGSMPAAADRGPEQELGVATASATTRSAVPDVRIVHAHAESSAVQEMYGYRPDHDASSGSAAVGPRGDRRFERLVESKVGADRGVTYVNEAMNSTIVARIDAAGVLSQVCVDGAAEDLTAHEPVVSFDGSHAEEMSAASVSATRGGE